MSDNSLFIILEPIVNYLAVINITIISIILSRKIINEKRDTDESNILRCLILGVFLSLLFTAFCEMFYENTPFGAGLSEELFTATNTLSLYTLGLSLMVTFALVVVVYVNQWKMLFYLPFIAFLVIIIFYFVSSIGMIFFYYVLVAALVGLIFLYITGLKLRDNDALGLAVFFTLGLIALIFANNLIGLFFNLIYPLFGIYFALGYFTLFKMK